MLGIDAKETIEYKSEKDQGGNPTVFVLGSFTNRDKLKIGMGSMDAQGKFDIDKFQDKIFDVLKVGIKSIKNLGGKDYPAMSEELLEAIPFDVLMEVFHKIMAMNFHTEEETKN